MTMRLDTILHPTDFSDSARHALRLAAGLARTHGSTLHIFHANTLHGEHREDTPAAFADYVASARELVAAPGAREGATVTSSESRALLPFDGIMQAASECHPDLVVIGAHGHSRFSRLLMGSTAEKVLRHAPCHVLTSRSESPIPEDGVFRNLLVPVDFSESSTRGLDSARALRNSARGTIFLVHVVEPAPPMYLAGDVASYFELDPELGQRIETNLRRWAGDIPDSKIIVAEGNPALEIARLSTSLSADLIVMSTKGLTDAAHLLVGSVTERVCRVANVPVFVAR